MTLLKFRWNRELVALHGEGKSNWELCVTTYLILSVECHHTRLMRTDDSFACLDDAGRSFKLELVGDEKEQE